MDINKHINGCGLVWTNHTESAPSMGTKALHDNLALTARSGLPHLARSSHAICAETPVRRGRSRTTAATQTTAQRRSWSGRRRAELVGLRGREPAGGETRARMVGGLADSWVSRDV